MAEKDHYARAGVDRDALRQFKARAREMAADTWAYPDTLETLSSFGVQRVSQSSAWSAVVTDIGYCYIAHVLEGLGTQNLTADTLRRSTESIAKQFPRVYWSIGFNTGAAIFNDLITTGAQPVDIALHPAVGDSIWFADKERRDDLLSGFAASCYAARSLWQGGETPGLKGIINPETIALSGASWGIIKPKERLIPGTAMAGDVILLLGSSGIHTNGHTLARDIGDTLTWEEGYGRDLGDGTTYGEVLLVPAVIYAIFVKACLDAGVPVHAAIHLTGEAWPKIVLACSGESLTCAIEAVPEQQPVFRFIQEARGISDKEMYSTYNMGVGFVLMVPFTALGQALGLAHHLGFPAMDGGRIVVSRTKRLVIVPKGIEWSEEELALR